ncbi:MAG: N-acetyltransferase [Caulobacteraceae bacterium]
MDSALPPLPGLVAETPADHDGVEALIAMAFGPGRFVKAAERLREGRSPRLDLSFVAREGGKIVGCVRQWDVKIGETPAILLGPFAVDPDWRSRGLGADLIERAVEAAKAAGESVILLVGDAPYFAPLGFEAAPGAVMPGPVDKRRVLLRRLSDTVGPLEGRVRAAD